LKVLTPVSLLTLLAISCGAQTNATHHHLYEIRRGIIHYKTQALLSTEETLIFDDYGEKQLILMETQVTPGMKILQLDTLQYTWTGNSQCIKARRKRKFSLQNLDFTALDSSSIKQYGIKKVDTIDFLGLKCNKYLLKNGRVEGEIIEWKNIFLYVHLTTKGIAQETKAYKIDTPQSLPPNIFDLPQKMEIIDATAIDNN
jgi:hypothetical protein